MPLDEELIKAVYESVDGSQQPESVAKRLLAWLDALSSSDLSAEDDSRHLDKVLNAMLTDNKE